MFFVSLYIFQTGFKRYIKIHVSFGPGLKMYLNVSLCIFQTGFKRYIEMHVSFGPGLKDTAVNQLTSPTTSLQQISGEL